MGSKHAVQWWPVIGVTAITVATFPLWWYRKSSTDPDLYSNDEGATSSISNSQAEEQLDTFKGKQYGRKSAVDSGMMEGDRAFQGIFPAKKMVKLMEPILPASKQEEHTSQQQQQRVNK